MTSLRIKIRWFKRNKNSFFYKLFAFIFPLISPTLSFELKMYRIVKINRVKYTIHCGWWNNRNGGIKMSNSAIITLIICVTLIVICTIDYFKNKK